MINYFNIELIKEVIFEVAIAIACGSIINIIYRKTYKGVALSKNFANTLTGLTIISYFIIKCVANNTLVSLGMVGALSIVRFRNSVKDSIDIMYAFWAIAQGILVGAQEYFLAITLNLIMVIVLMVIFKLNNQKSKKMILVVRYNDKMNLEIFEEKLKKSFKSFLLKEQKIGKVGEIIVEVMSFNNQISTKLEDIKIDGVEDISLIDYVEPLI